MREKVCLVTGGTSGIGLYTALGLARKQAALVIVSRNKQKCIQSVDWINTQTNNPYIDYIQADLSSQVELRRFVNDYKERYTRLDVLVNNVGAAFLTKKLSVDGIEMTFALNHLSYFLTTNLLLDMLKDSSPARVVNISSGNHFGQSLDFNNLQWARGYNPFKTYGRSKLANILFTYELNRRLQGSGVTANVMNPGRVATNIWKKTAPIIGPIASMIMSRNAQTPEEGADAVVYLASSPDVEGVSGKYFRKKVMMESDPVTYDLKSAEQLWDISAQLTKLVTLDSINEYQSARVNGRSLSPRSLFSSKDW